MGENTLGDKAVAEIGKTVREVARRMMNEQPHRGRWQFQGGSSGGGHTIWFTIDSVLCPDTDYVLEETLVVTADYYAAGCSKTPPGANDDGSYNVYDFCSSFNGLTPTELVGTKGKATYAYPLSDDCEPRWFIDFLCGLPQC